MKQYEYQILTSGAKVDAEQLNKIGASGWELVTVLEHQATIMIWKRERPGQVEPVKVIRDHVEMLLAHYELRSGCETGADVCSGILFFIDDEL
jgi:hypothetical protein